MGGNRARGFTTIRTQRSQWPRSFEIAADRLQKRRGEKMTTRTLLTVGLLLAAVPAFGQGASNWPCADDLVKSEGQRVRISMGIALALAERTIPPDVSDL